LLYKPKTSYILKRREYVLLLLQRKLNVYIYACEYVYV
jgi:hypothetical protein